MAVGTLEPRKNLGSLITAFLDLLNSGQLINFTLLIAGQPGWRNASIHRQLAASSAKNIRWLGYLADDDLVALYQGAAAFVMPSFYEGFGMPVLEARVAGTPVLASDIPELREAGGPDCVYVTPSKDGIKKGLLKILSIKKKPDPVPAAASWEEAGRVMANLFRQAAFKRSSAVVQNRWE